MTQEPQDDKELPEVADEPTWYNPEADNEVQPEEEENAGSQGVEASEDEESTEFIAAAPKKRRFSGAGITIAVLLAVLGFTLVVQVKSNSTDAAFASQRESDLVQIMSDLDSAERRLNDDIESLEDARRELQSGASNQAAAQAEARKRADALGILAGTLPATGQGVEISIVAGSEPVNASDLLTVVQLLRIGDAEAIQINGREAQVRIVAGTSFVDADGAVRVDGIRLTGPYTLLAIGEPALLKGAVEFAGGVVTRLTSTGGKLIVEIKDPVEIKATRTTSSLVYAEPVS